MEESCKHCDIIWIICRKLWKALKRNLSQLSFSFRNINFFSAIYTTYLGTIYARAVVGICASCHHCPSLTPHARNILPPHWSSSSRHVHFITSKLSLLLKCTPPPVAGLKCQKMNALALSSDSEDRAGEQLWGVCSASVVSLRHHSGSQPNSRHFGCSPFLVSLLLVSSVGKCCPRVPRLSHSSLSLRMWNPNQHESAVGWVKSEEVCIKQGV